MPRLKDESKASVDELVAALGHPDRDQRLRAQAALAGRGESALPVLIEKMHNAKLSLVAREHALWAMHQLGEKAGTPDQQDKARGLIRQMLADDNAALQVQAIRAVGLQRTEAAADELCQLARNGDAFTRLSALTALARLRKTSPAVAHATVSALQDQDSWVRFAARAAASVHGWNEFERLLKEGDVPAREAVWTALARTSPDQSASLAIFLREAQSPDKTARWHAMNALSRAAYLPQVYDGHWWGTQPGEKFAATE